MAAPGSQPEAEQFPDAHPDFLGATNELSEFDFTFRDRELDGSVESSGKPPARVVRFNPRRFVAPLVPPQKPSTAQQPQQAQPAAGFGASPPKVNSPRRRDRPPQPATQLPPLPSSRISAPAAAGWNVPGAPPVSPRDDREKGRGYAVPELTAALQRELLALEQDDVTDALLSYVLHARAGE